MNLLELMRHRRSIRKYQDKQIERKTLEKIIEAGTYAPNAGGGQRTLIIGVHDATLAARIGRMNLLNFDRNGIHVAHVSSDQPSIIDDPSIQSAFYGAPSVCIIFAQKNFPYSIPDAFCCAENMVLMACDLGLGSCVVVRAEETFANPEGNALLREWQVPEDYIARCFVLVGYIAGSYPSEKPRKDGRIRIVGE